MRHQYGKQLFHYRELPKILKSGLEAGIDTLFMNDSHNQSKYCRTGKSSKHIWHFFQDKRPCCCKDYMRVKASSLAW